jgi:hypothetical protein
MRQESEIKQRIAELSATISHVNKKIAEEDSKPMHERDHGLLVFLNQESLSYEFTLSQLKWVLLD